MYPLRTKFPPRAIVLVAFTPPKVTLSEINRPTATPFNNINNWRMEDTVIGAVFLQCVVSFVMIMEMEFVLIICY